MTPGYANFAVANPPLKLVLIENPGRGGTLNHLGVEVENSQTVQKALLSASFSNHNDMNKARSERVLQARADTGPPWSWWAVILLTSGLLLGCAIIYGVESAATHYTMVAILGCSSGRRCS